MATNGVRSPAPTVRGPAGLSWPTAERFCWMKSAEIELPLQAKLLRVLQEKSFERVGSSSTIRVDVRVHGHQQSQFARRKLRRACFREDLYYRLAVVPIQVPPLRDRREDIPELGRTFSASLCHNGCGANRANWRPRRLICSASYSWPGNVRELENIVARASVSERRRAHSSR